MGWPSSFLHFYVVGKGYEIQLYIYTGVLGQLFRAAFYFFLITYKAQLFTNQGEHRLFIRIAEPGKCITNSPGS